MLNIEEGSYLSGKIVVTQIIVKHFGWVTKERTTFETGGIIQLNYMNTYKKADG